MMSKITQVFALDQQNGKGNFKLLPSTSRSCQSFEDFCSFKGRKQR